MRKDSGFSLIEAIIGVFISSLLFMILFPSVNYFFKFYNSVKYGEQLSIIQRVSSDLSLLINSTSIESDSKDLIGSKNIGFKILNTQGVYLNNVNRKSISRYILPSSTKGDSLYIETPFITSKTPLSFSNNFHIYRLSTPSNISKKQSLNYIPGNSEGSKIKPLNFGKEEIVLTDIYDAYFVEERGGVFFYFKIKNGMTFEFFFERVGEL